jgi:Mg2+ and Co2+ transporter CorA
MENAILERLKNQSRNLQVLSEELQVQMALGKAEARDLIEKERKNLAKFISKQRTELDKSMESFTAGRRDFLTCVENLESSLNEEIPEKVKKYELYKSQLLQRVYELEEAIRKNYPDMGETMQTKLDAFKAKMDAFRVNLALHDKDDPEKVERIRNEFSEKLIEVRKLLAARETAQGKLDNFMEDISESFSYLKRAISDLSN